jgi:uncharacterized protein DUF3846
MATLIPAAGAAREITPANGRAFTLAELQGIVGGYIEAIAVPRDVGVFVGAHVAFLNEDGKRLNLPTNATAMMLWRHMLRPDDWIVGDVVVCTALEAGEGSDGE